MDWLVVALAAGFVSAILIGVGAYLHLERKIHTTAVLTATVDQLYRDRTLSLALRKIHEGDVATASKQLDILLCDDILLLNSELESADEHTRALVGDTFRRIGRVRPKTQAQGATAANSVPTTDQIEAEQILSLAMADRLKAQPKSEGM